MVIRVWWWVSLVRIVCRGGHLWVLLVWWALGQEGLVDHHRSGWLTWLWWVWFGEWYGCVGPPGINLLEKRPNNCEHKQVEEKVGDGDPILQRGPVMRDHHPDVLEADDGGDDHPGYQHTMVPGMSPNYKQQSAYDSKKSIKNRILDQRSNTDILAFALLTIGINKLGILDNIEDCCNDGDDELDDTNDDDG